jgi:hypothetical protein
MHKPSCWLVVERRLLNCFFVSVFQPNARKSETGASVGRRKMHALPARREQCFGWLKKQRDTLGARTARVLCFLRIGVFTH